MGVLYEEIEYFKSRVALFVKLITIGSCLKLSNEVLFICSLIGCKGAGGLSLDSKKFANPGHSRNEFTL